MKIISEYLVGIITNCLFFYHPINSQPRYTSPSCDSLIKNGYAAYIYWNDQEKTQPRSAILIVQDYSRLNYTLDTFRFNGILFSKDVYHQYLIDSIDSMNVCSCIDSKSWYDNGKLKSEILYFDSNGSYYRYYYQNGAVQTEGYIQKNAFVGIWRRYTEAGLLIQD